jgi:hypothetical protein
LSRGWQGPNLTAERTWWHGGGEELGERKEERRGDERGHMCVEGERKRKRERLRIYWD